MFFRMRGFAGTKLLLVVLAAVLAVGCARAKKAEQGQSLNFSAGGELRPVAAGQPLFSGREADRVFLKLDPFLSSRDLMMVDFAGGLDQGCQPLSRPEVLRWSPEWLPLISRANLKVLNLADDHALDCGREALNQAVNLMLGQGFYLVGAGRGQKEATAPVYLTRKGVTISLVSFLLEEPPGIEKCESCTGPSLYDRQALINAFAEMKNRAQYQILVLHFRERELPALTEDELAIVREGIDFGADLILGFGPGSAGGLYRIRGRWVIGSLGRLTGDAEESGFKAVDGLLLSAEFSADQIMNLRVCALDLDNGRPRLLRSEEGEAALTKLVSGADTEVRDNVKLIGDILYLK